MKKVEVPLTARQRRFASEYLVDLCGAKAAVRAGYSKKSADRYASRLLRHPAIVSILGEHAKKASRDLDLNAKRLEEELVRIAYVDPRKLCGEDGRVLELHELDEDTARAVASVKYRVAKVVRGAKAASVAEAEGIDAEVDGRVVEELVLGTLETRFHPKVEAIGLGFKRLGVLVEKIQLEPPIRAEEITDDEWKDLAALHHQLRDSAPGSEWRPPAGTAAALAEADPG